MPTWKLDDGPFGRLAKFARIADLPNWPSGKLFVAEQTALDAIQDTVRNALLTADPTPFQVFRIMMGTHAADIVYSHLRRTASRAAANLAEHQCIAWIIAERRDAVFVTEDRKAAFLALAELGRGRVAHAHDLWLYLRDERLVDRKQFENLCRATCRNDRSDIPLRCR